MWKVYYEKYKQPKTWWIAIRSINWYYEIRDINWSLIDEVCFTALESLWFEQYIEELPKTFEEFAKMEKYATWIVWPIMMSEKYRKNIVALDRLLLLRDCYRDWREPKKWEAMCAILIKHCPINSHILCVCESMNFTNVLLFQGQKIAQEFFDNFKDLIIEASPLLFWFQLKAW